MCHTVVALYNGHLSTVVETKDNAWTVPLPPPPKKNDR